MRRTSGYVATCSKMVNRRRWPGLSVTKNNNQSWPSRKSKTDRPLSPGLCSEAYHEVTAANRHQPPSTVGGWCCPISGWVLTVGSCGLFRGTTSVLRVVRRARGLHIYTLTTAAGGGVGGG